jgi:hypothetical protein
MWLRGQNIIFCQISQNALNNNFEAGPEIVWLLMYVKHAHFKTNW